MRQIRFFILVGLILILISGNSWASNLNLGEDVYKLKVTNFSSSNSSYNTFDLGYGVDNYSGYGVEVIIPGTDSNQAGIVEVEYQFIPKSKQKKNKDFNYALKIGATSGDIFQESNPGIKAGVIIERELEEKLVYFDGNLIANSTTVVDAEFGICGELSEGILGVLGFKAVGTSNSGSDNGTVFGIKVAF